MKFVMRKFIAITLTLLATQTIFAATSQQQSQCPSVAAIKLAGVDMVEQDSEGTWKACKEDRFGTKGTWLLIEGPITADTADAALLKANTAISALVFTGESSGPPWSVCEYGGQFQGSELVALAIPYNNQPDDQQIRAAGCSVFPLKKKLKA